MIKKIALAVVLSTTALSAVAEESKDFYAQVNAGYAFGMKFPYSILKNIIDSDENTILIQCALSLGHSRYFLSPFWKHNEYIQEKKSGNVIENKVNPDFHQPEKYWKLKLI